MHKKRWLFLLLAVPVSIFSQEGSFGVTGGYATDGYAAHVSYNHELNQNGYLQIALFASDNTDRSNAIDIPYRTFSLNLGYYRNVFKDRNSRFHLALGGGGSAAYEMLNNGDAVLENGAVIQDDTQVVYGGFVGSELKYHLSDSFALSGVINTYLYANSDLGAGTMYAGLGIRFYTK